VYPVEMQGVSLAYAALLMHNVLLRRALVGRRGAQQYTVSNKFINFFYKLWTIFKLDTLIKVNLHTMMQLPQFAEAKTLQETAALLEMRMDEMKLLGKGKSYSHCPFLAKPIV
jgi:hypothetical protein